MYASATFVPSKSVASSSPSFVFLLGVSVLQRANGRTDVQASFSLAFQRISKNETKYNSVGSLSCCFHCALT